MSQVTEYDVEAINLGRKQALLNTGVVVAISQFFDEDGDETDDPAEALAIVVPFPDGMHWSGAVSIFEASKTRH